MATVTLRVTVSDEALAEGWGGDLTEYGASVEAALYEVQADSGMAYRPAVEHVTALVEAADRVACLGYDAWHDLATGLTCNEAESVKALLVAAHGPHAGDAFMLSHARGDDEGDKHYDAAVAGS